MDKQIRWLLAAIAALSMAACGGGDDESPPREGGREIAKARLIEKADGICRRNDEKLTSELSKISPPDRGSESIALVAPYLELYAQTVQGEVASISALGTPSTDVDVLNDYLDRRATAANGLRSSARAARAGDISGFAAGLEQFEQNQGRELAKRFGFTACGIGAPSVPPQEPEAR